MSAPLYFDVHDKQEIAMILEVMDKEPPLGEILAPLAFVGIAAYLLCLRKPKAWIVALPLCLLMARIMTSEIFAEFVGPAIRSEDPVYWYTSVFTALACGFAPLLGSIMSPRRANRSQGSPRDQE